MMYLTDEDLKIAKENGIAEHLCRQRFYSYGWTAERARTEAIHTAKPEWLMWKETAIANGISNQTFNSRLKRGLSAERAATDPIDLSKRKHLKS